MTAVSRVCSLLPAVSTLARWALAVVWGYAGLSKVADPEATVRAVRAYRLLPEPAVLVMGTGCRSSRHSATRSPCNPQPEPTTPHPGSAALRRELPPAMNL